MTSLKDTLFQAKEKFLQYYNRQTPRDQKAMMLLGAFCTCVMVFQFVWLPLHELKDNALKDATRNFKDFMWLSDNTASLSSIANAASSRSNSGVSLLQAINNAATQQNVSLSNFNAESEDQVRLSLLNASFDRVMQFIDILEGEYGFTLADVTITKVNDSGIVNTQMTVSEGLY